MKLLILFLPLLLLFGYSIVNKLIKSQLSKNQIEFNKYFPTIDAWNHLKRNPNESNNRVRKLTFISIGILICLVFSLANSFLHQDRITKQFVDLLNSNILNFEGTVVEKYQRPSTFDNNMGLGNKLVILKANGSTQKVSIINQPRFYSEVDSGDYVIKNKQAKYILLIRESDTLKFAKN